MRKRGKPLETVENRRMFYGTSGLRHVRAGGDDRRLLYLPHRHEDYQLLIVSAGAGCVSIEDFIVDYRPGDVLLIGKNVTHCYLKNADGSDGFPLCGDLVQFRGELFPEHLEKFSEYVCVGAVLARSLGGVRYRDKKLCSQLRTMLAKLDREKGAGRVAALLKMLDRIGKCRKWQAFPETSMEPSLELYARDEIFHRLSRYVYDNLASKITLKEAAEAAGMNPSALCRTFKKHSGVTLFDFVNKARIEKTCSLLLHTNFSIAQTAYAAGFNNIAYFNRRFKSEVGTSPLEYRKKMR